MLEDGENTKCSPNREAILRWKNEVGTFLQSIDQFIIESLTHRWTQLKWLGTHTHSQVGGVNSDLEAFTAALCTAEGTVRFICSVVSDSL